ncbi:MAG: prolipoprotein diacylglyceryl transferase [Armatimonadota bacterium]
MRSILFAVGPWSWGAIVILWAGVFFFVILWQYLENREEDRKLKPTDYAWTALVSGVAALVLLYLVNHFGPLTVKAYGVMLLLAFAAGTWWTVYSADDEDLQLSEVIDVALLALVGSIIGARVVYVALEHHQFASFAGVFDVWSGGLSFHGGLAGALLAGWGYCRYKKHSFFRTIDQFAPGIALGYSFARIGCFLNGCCHGSPTDLPWAVTFPSSGACSLPGVPLHPSQLYASAAAFIIFLVLVRLKPFLKQHGHLFLSFLMLYSVARFLVEYTRSGVTAEPLYGTANITVAQFASAIIFVIAGIVMAVTWPKDPGTDG